MQGFLVFRWSGCFWPQDKVESVGQLCFLAGGLCGSPPFAEGLPGVWGPLVGELQEVAA